jgi:hypothetical protein
MTILYDLFILTLLLLRTALELIGVILLVHVVRDMWNDYRCKAINRRYQAHRLKQIKDGIYGT